MIAFVQKMIDKSQQNVIAKGSVSAIDPVNRAQSFVTFDGSFNSAPVKCLPDVMPMIGDRVALAKVGSEWTIIGSFTAKTPVRWLYIADSGPTGSTSSASFVDFPGPITGTFTKYYDWTRIRLEVFVRFFFNAGTGTAEIGLQLVSTTAPYTSADILMSHDVANTATDYESGHQMRELPDAVNSAAMPAGEYTITLRWRRQAGSVSLNSDSNGRNQIEVTEIV